MTTQFRYFDKLMFYRSSCQCCLPFFFLKFLSLKEWLQSIGSVVGKSWVYLLLLYVYVQVSRCIVVGALFPFLRYFGYGLDWKEAIILIWSGLRGAVALSLSLSVKASIY